MRSLLQPWRSLTRSPLRRALSMGGAALGVVGWLTLAPTALGGSSRQANVRFGANATATFSGGATLAMIGSATASTNVDNQGTGNYGITINGGTWNATYYQFRNMNSTGLNLAGATTITNMNNGDFSLDLTGGSSITIASTTVDQNASTQMFTVKFATSSVLFSARKPR